MSDRDERIARLEARLHDGYTRIGEAMSRGVQVDNWERHWLELLREYVALEDEKMAHRLEQAAMAGMPRAEVAA